MCAHKGQGPILGDEDGVGKREADRPYTLWKTRDKDVARYRTVSIDLDGACNKRRPKEEICKKNKGADKGRGIWVGFARSAALKTLDRGGAFYVGEVWRIEGLAWYATSHARPSKQVGSKERRGQGGERGPSEWVGPAAGGSTRCLGAKGAKVFGLSGGDSSRKGHPYSPCRGRSSKKTGEGGVGP